MPDDKSHADNACRSHDLGRVGDQVDDWLQQGFEEAITSMTHPLDHISQRDAGFSDNLKQRLLAMFTKFGPTRDGTV